MVALSILCPFTCQPISLKTRADDEATLGTPVTHRLLHYHRHASHEPALLYVYRTSCMTPNPTKPNRAATARTYGEDALVLSPDLDLLPD